MSLNKSFVASHPDFKMQEIQNFEHKLKERIWNGVYSLYGMCKELPEGSAVSIGSVHLTS